MKIAVTGASGFIGTELLGQLKETGNTTVALTRGGLGDAASGARVQWKTTDYSKESLTEVFEGADAVSLLDHCCLSAILLPTIICPSISRSLCSSIIVKILCSHGTIYNKLNLSKL